MRLVVSPQSCSPHGGALDCAATISWVAARLFSRKIWVNPLMNENFPWPMRGLLKRKFWCVHIPPKENSSMSLLPPSMVLCSGASLCRNVAHFPSKSAAVFMSRVLMVAVVCLVRLRALSDDELCPPQNSIFKNPPFAWNYLQRNSSYATIYSAIHPWRFINSRPLSSLSYYKIHPWRFMNSRTLSSLSHYKSHPWRFYVQGHWNLIEIK